MKCIDRIVSATGINNIVEALSAEKLTLGDLHSLILVVFEKKIGAITPAEVMKNYKENRFSAIASTNQREMIELDRMLYEVVPAYFLPIELSPVNPIGANATLTSLDPKVVLSTIRNLEVVGDPSMSLAIECAERRRLLRTAKEGTEIHLATSHRVLRLQSFQKESNLTSHFRAFALASAARDVAGFNRFELSSLSAHIEAWLNFLTRASDAGYEAQNVSVAISDIRIAEKLISGSRISRDEVIHRAKDRTFNLFAACSINCQDRLIALATFLSPTRNWKPISESFNSRKRPSLNHSGPSIRPCVSTLISQGARA